MRPAALGRNQFKLAVAARLRPETAGGYTPEKFFRVFGLLNLHGGSWGAWQPALSITGAHWACPDSLIASNLATRDGCLGSSGSAYIHKIGPSYYPHQRQL